MKIIEQPDTFLNTDNLTEKIKTIPDYIYTWPDASYVRQYLGDKLPMDNKVTAVWNIIKKSQFK